MAHGYDGLLVNLNTTGGYITSEPIPAPGARIALRFHLPGSTRLLEVHGRVAWVSHRQTHPVHSLPPGCGVEFGEMSDDLRARIGKALAALANGR